MMTKSKRESGLTAPARKCLATLLESELKGEQVEFHTWRAANARRIPLLDELRHNRAIEGDTHCAVTFWGLLNAPGKRAQAAIGQCERVFKALRRYYPKHPKEPLSLEDLAKQTKLQPPDALRSCHFLSRSPAYLSIHTHEGALKVSPNEQYVTFKGFEDLKDRARAQARPSLGAVLPHPLAHGTISAGLAHYLETSECDAVRECWHRAIDRLPRDPAGAITAARSLTEAACKYVLEEHGEKSDSSLDLPKLYKKATVLMQLDASTDISTALRRVLLACATVVDGLAELRNKMGDAHGRGRHSAKPARRHAEFVVMIAGAIAGLLLATLDAQRTP